jgi:hypothetical protein
MVAVAFQTVLERHSGRIKLTSTRPHAAEDGGTKQTNERKRGKPVHAEGWAHRLQGDRRIVGRCRRVTERKEEGCAVVDPDVRAAYM